MSLQEQIDAAWKAETPKVREALQCSRASQVLGAAEVGFAAGYRAMAKRLYREVKPEERRHRAQYDCLIQDGTWRYLMHLNKGYSYWDCYTEENVPEEMIAKTFRYNGSEIPLPSDIFVEEG